MFKTKGTTMLVTRGDHGYLDIDSDDNGKPYLFVKGDVIRFNLMKKDKCDNIIFQKDITVTEDTEIVTMEFTQEDTRRCPVVSKPTEYWYEIKLNPDTKQQTILGYDDEEGAKEFMLYPEGHKGE